MSNSDPEHEVRDVDAPENRVLVTGDAKAGTGLVEEGIQTHQGQRDREHDASVPQGAGGAERAQDVVVDLRETHDHVSAGARQASGVTFFK